MSKKQPNKKPKQPKRKHQKPISMYGIPLDEAIADILKSPRLKWEWDCAGGQNFSYDFLNVCALTTGYRNDIMVTEFSDDDFIPVH